jgi:hypothetical protein
MTFVTRTPLVTISRHINVELDGISPSRGIEISVESTGLNAPKPEDFRLPMFFVA